MRPWSLLLLSGCVGYATNLADPESEPASVAAVNAALPQVERDAAPSSPVPGLAPERGDAQQHLSAIEAPVKALPVDRGGTMNGAEYVWIDQDITWDVNNVGEDVAHAPPVDWNSPLDYFNGKIEVRLDVTSKHDATKVWLELCAWHDYLGSSNHTCVHCLDPNALTRPGSYTCETNAGAFEPSTFWGSGFAAMEHRVKDGTSGRGTDLQNEGIGLPISAHYSIVLVPKNMTFSGWSHYPH